ncbi:phosphate ABC transporter substrate-binding/OmpA family protein [Rheinheimera pleomorphica]|uniref:phosphate ABC transporter substrate-binding/OmpA family protein n=1 Tax=Rheinheimera pleomorphica TaxID=2703963 RepID=UPI0019D5D31E|nr:phosphate ABC transporter substrate-binding/OmpA family protein [Rheinheimera pleomorphica]
MSVTSTNYSGVSNVLSRLVQLCQSKFQIQLSLAQLQDNADYRAAVVAELAALKDEELDQLLHQLDKAQNTATDATIMADTKVVSATGNRNLVLAALVVSVVALMSAGYVWFASNQAQPSQIVSATTAVTTPVVQQMQTETAVTVKSASTVASVRTPVLRVHGSNTVGEKLAPALLEAFLAQQGGRAFSWQQGNSEVERQLRYDAAGQTAAIELHAHGSGTAFTGLLAGKADIGMSSRRVTADEVTQARAELGDLSKIGNEHIIALDGLAIIVNQNNSLKAISTETLAKIYAGEISRWSQLGGVDKPIVLLARDNNSGTYDTFNSLVLKKHGKKLADNAKRFESSTELSVAVSQDEAAIGFIGLNYISYNKALAISEGADTTPIYPTRFTISTEDYALSRRLYLYTPTAASQLAKDFAQFAISEQGQQLVEQSGLISQNIRIEKAFAVEGAPASYNRYAETGQRLSLNFRFNYGENDLDNKGKRDLERLIRFMEQNSGRRLVLMGFSDAVGAVAKNEELALRRAKAVERELTARGIPVVAVESYGELLPVANNDTDAGRERNRRVEVWVL